MTISKPLAITFFAIPWCVACFSFLWLIVVRYPLSGIFHVETALDGNSAWIFPLLPAERASSPGVQAEGWIGQRITGDPTYFTARIPGPYERVTVQLDFRSVHQPLIEAGIVRDAAGADVELRPLFSEQLSSSEWNPVEATRTSSGGFVLNSVSSKRLRDDNPKGIAVWDAPMSYPELKDASSSELIATKVSLRGSHDFYIVPAGDTVRFRLTLQAANRSEGRDVIAFRIFRGDEEIKQQSLGTSGSREQRMGTIIEHDIEIPNAAPGVYRISLLAPDDVFIRNIQTTSKRWMVGPRVYFGDVVGYATTTAAASAWTDSQHLVAETFHQEGIQTIRFGSASLNLQRTHVATRANRTNDSSAYARVDAPQGDVRLIGDGLFALREDAFLTVRPRRMTDQTKLREEGIEAVRTSYKRPEPLGDGWMRATFEVPIQRTQEQLRFVIGAPGIAARAGAVDVRRISLTYSRPVIRISDWLTIMRHELANAWRRLSL